MTVMKMTKRLQQICTMLMSGLCAVVTVDAATPKAPVLVSIDGQIVDTPSGAPGTHEFTGLPLTSDGWTDIQNMVMAAGKYNDARIVYVSSSQGNDQTAKPYSKTSTEVGGRPLAPVGQVVPYASLAAAYAQLRNGYPDIMLLKRGDSWSGGLSVGKAGRNSTERMIVGAYGPETTDRPIAAAITSNSSASYLILTSAENTDRGNITYSGAYVLIEDYLWHGNGVDDTSVGAALFDDGHSGIRRSTMDRKGLFAGWDDVDDGSTSFIEENTIYANKGGSGTGFTHNVYLQYNIANINSIKNQSFESPGVGYRQRGGGRIEQNLVVKHNPTQSLPSWDIGESDRTSQVTFRNNLTMHSMQGMLAINWVNSVADGNIFTTQRTPWAVWEFRRDNALDYRNVTFSNNIFWNMLDNSFTGSSFTGPVEIRGSTFHRASGTLLGINSSQVTYSGNKYFSSSPTSQWFAGGLSYAGMIPATGSGTEPNYPDPNRNMLTYMRSVGANPATLDEAITWYSTGVPGVSVLGGSVKNRRGAWDTRFTATAVINYVRGGFGLSVLP